MGSIPTASTTKDYKMDLQRFEQVINDEAVNRDSEMAEVLKELLAEHKELQKNAAPTLWVQFKIRMKSLSEPEYWLTTLIFIPTTLLVCTLLFSIVGGIIFGGSHNGYYLYQYQGCTRVVSDISWSEDSAATGCIQNPHEAVAVLERLQRGEQNVDSSDYDGSGSGSMQVPPRARDTEAGRGRPRLDKQDNPNP